MPLYILSTARQPPLHYLLELLQSFLDHHSLKRPPIQIASCAIFRAYITQNLKTAIACWISTTNQLCMRYHSQDSTPTLDFLVNDASYFQNSVNHPLCSAVQISSAYAVVSGVPFFMGYFTYQSHRTERRPSAVVQILKIGAVRASKRDRRPVSGKPS